MSAGSFDEGKYESDNSAIWRCKVQPETKQLTLNSVANAYPAAAATAGLPRIKLSTNRNTVGIRPRYVSVVLTADGTGNKDEYLSGTKHEVKVFQKSVFDGYALGDTGTYLGIACQLVFKSGEASS